MYWLVMQLVTCDTKYDFRLAGGIYANCSLYVEVNYKVSTPIYLPLNNYFNRIHTIISTQDTDCKLLLYLLLI